MNEPLIVTLRLDEATFQYFDALRQVHFPAERNYLRAHLTLFHHLPGNRAAAVHQTLAKTATRTAPLPLRVAEVKMIGRGGAFALRSEALLSLRAGLARRWADWLTPQDQQRLWPHVTVQNKVTPAAARALHAELAAAFEPFDATGEALQLWAYRGGPWEHLADITFGGAEKNRAEG